MTVWAARVAGTELAPAVWDFLKANDAALLPYDCRASALHARRLGAAGILTPDEVEQAEAALAAIAQDGNAVLRDVLEAQRPRHLLAADGVARAGERRGAERQHVHARAARRGRRSAG